MGKGVDWAYMLPIEAVFQSISKTLGSLHPDLPSPEVQIAHENLVGGANQSYNILPYLEDRPELSYSESPKLKLSESRSDKHDLEYSPAALTFPRVQHSTERRKSDLTDDSRGSAIADESIAWVRKAVLSLGKILKKLETAERALVTLISKLQMATGCVCTLVF